MDRNWTVVEGKVQGFTGSTGSGSNEFRGFHMPMKNTLKNTLKKTEKHVLKPATSVFSNISVLK